MPAAPGVTPLLPEGFLAPFSCGIMEMPSANGHHGQVGETAPDFPSFPNSIWERSCRRDSIAPDRREMEFREEQETFPSTTWERD
jgi:hypothetical protein